MQCISLPGPGTSAIQLEAFKKLLLTLVIDPLNIARASGSFHTVPTGVTATLPRHRRDGLSSLARPYVDFVKAIESLDATAARKVVGDHRVVFERDGNAGLAQTAIDGSLPLRQLLLLRRVYSVAPLSVVAKALGVSGDGVEEVLVRTVSCLLSHWVAVLCYAYCFPRHRSPAAGSLHASTRVAELLSFLHRSPARKALMWKTLRWLHNCKSG